MKAIFDTCILIDYLAGKRLASDELLRYESRVISRITWMEVMVGSKTDQELNDTTLFLSHFGIAELSKSIAEEAVKIRRNLKLKIPDAIILATAHVNQCLLVTRNTKDFTQNMPNIRIPY